MSPTHTPEDHFQGKSVPEHLKEARRKGALASSEIHGTEIAGHIGAFADSAKESAVYLLLLWVVLHQMQMPFSQMVAILSLFSCGLLIWKAGRSALLGWARLERLHRVIEEERWEIEHHRAQEREELYELYRAKGFSGKLLDEVIEVLMADDNRLLNIMLEEELGLTLEVYEHPLKQGAFAALGVLGAAGSLLLLLLAIPSFGLPLGSLIWISLAVILATRQEKNQASPALVWNLATVAMVAAFAFFLVKIL
ncbi:MAG: VIT1/CCC1 transporter family protein [Chlamydiales bacterium]|nr:VIT1/CCC1 transporter family protein [Chlamydiales bacterium]